MKTDDELKKEIQEELKWEPMLERDEIEVEANEGIIVLNGVVSSEEKRSIAEAAVRKIPEVKDIKDNIEVKPGKIDELDEQDMTKSTFGQAENILADTDEKKLKISGA